MIEYVFNPFTANLDVIDVFQVPQVQVEIVDSTIHSLNLIVADHPIVVNTERIMLNGLELVMGSDADYTLMNDHIQFTPGVLEIGDRVKITYQIKVG